MGAPRYTAQQVADALTQAKGFLSIAANNLGCAQNTVRNYIERHPICKQACTDAREMMIDVTEGRLYQAVNEGNITAIIFLLKTQGKHRGYVERQEVTGKNGDDIPIRIVDYRNGLATLAGGSNDDSG